MMPRLSLLCLALALVCVRATTEADEPELQPLTLGPGPHLLIDDYLVGEQSLLQRTVNTPKKRPEPVIPGGDAYRIFQPFVSVVRNAKTGTFRMWYEVPDGRPDYLPTPDADISHVAYTESRDGVTWRPPKVLRNFFRDKSYTHACRVLSLIHI